MGSGNELGDPHRPSPPGRDVGGGGAWGVDVKENARRRRARASGKGITRSALEWRI